MENRIKKLLNVDRIKYFPKEFEKKLEGQRKRFVKKFDLQKIENMSLEQYALQKEREKSKESFCYWVETKLEPLGNIHGSSAAKFGVYYGNPKNKNGEYEWHWTKKWKMQDIEEIRTALYDLIIAGEKIEKEKIISSKISPMFKMKLLALYYPEKYLNIYSVEHIRFFLKEGFGVYRYSDNVLEDSLLLLNLKNKDKTMKTWSNIQFSYFLYYCFQEVKEKSQVRFCV